MGGVAATVAAAALERVQLSEETRRVSELVIEARAAALQQLRHHAVSMARSRAATATAHCRACDSSVELFQAICSEDYGEL